MHHALLIHEIVFNIIAHCQCHPNDHTRKKSDLLALATTCHAFKEPALDLLWDELDDLFPLVQCLPGAFHRLSDNNKYAFDRQLSQTEWEILQSYTRRIRRIRYTCQQLLDEKSLGILSNPPTNEPLFPNLRSLSYVAGSTELQQSFKLFSSSQYLTSVVVSVDECNISVDKLVSSSICRWQNVQFLYCPTISLASDALAHLARMPALSNLSCKEVASDSVPPLLFSPLRKLTLYPASLDTSSWLLSHILLPAIESLNVHVDDCPSEEDLSSLLASIKTCNTGHTIQNLTVVHNWDSDSMDTDCLLCFSDLRPCMEFSTLRTLEVDIRWDVGITDDELVMLASAWPNLQQLSINQQWGWNTEDGITPNGFLQLLQACPSLNSASLVLDTRDYTELSPTNPGFTIPHEFDLDVLDSVIEEESVPAIVALFKNIHLSTVFSWLGYSFEGGCEASNKRWMDVDSQISW